MGYTWMSFNSKRNQKQCKLFGTRYSQVQWPSIPGDPDRAGQDLETDHGARAAVQNIPEIVLFREGRNRSPSTYWSQKLSCNRCDEEWPWNTGQRDHHLHRENTSTEENMEHRQRAEQGRIRDDYFRLEGPETSSTDFQSQMCFFLFPYS